MGVRRAFPQLARRVPPPAGAAVRAGGGRRARAARHRAGRRRRSRDDPRGRDPGRAPAPGGPGRRGRGAPRPLARAGPDERGRCATRRCGSGPRIPRSGATSRATRSACSTWPPTTWGSRPGTTRCWCSTIRIPRARRGLGARGPARRAATPRSPTTAVTAANGSGRSGHADFQAASRLPTTYVFPRRAETMTVLRRALVDDPRDATAHALVGALELSSGRVEAAIESWDRARGLDPRMAGAASQPRARPPPRRPARPRAGGPGRGPDRGPVERRGVPRRSTRCSACWAARRRSGWPPSSAIRNRARCRPRSSSSSPSRGSKPAGSTTPRRLFPGRFFPREEFGTNPRQVYLEARLQRALALAREGRREEALRSAAHLGDAVPGLSFTQDGMDEFLGGARVQYLLGEVLALAGDEAAARQRWQAAAAGRDRYPHADAAFVFLAQRRLGIGTDEERRATPRSHARVVEQSPRLGDELPGRERRRPGLLPAGARARGGSAREAARGAAAAGQDDVPLPEPRGPGPGHDGTDH